MYAIQIRLAHVLVSSRSRNECWCKSIVWGAVWERDFTEGHSAQGQRQKVIFWLNVSPITGLGNDDYIYKSSVFLCWGTVAQNVFGVTLHDRQFTRFIFPVQLECYQKWVCCASLRDSTEHQLGVFVLFNSKTPLTPNSFDAVFLSIPPMLLQIELNNAVI